MCSKKLDQHDTVEGLMPAGAEQWWKLKRNVLACWQHFVRGRSKLKVKEWVHSSGRDCPTDVVKNAVPWIDQQISEIMLDISNLFMCSYSIKLDFCTYVTEQFTSASCFYWCCPRCIIIKLVKVLCPEMVIVLIIPITINTWWLHMFLSTPTDENLLSKQSHWFKELGQVLPKYYPAGERTHERIRIITHAMCRM